MAAEGKPEKRRLIGSRLRSEPALTKSTSVADSSFFSSSLICSESPRKHVSSRQLYRSHQTFPWKRCSDVDSRASRGGGGGGVHVCHTLSLSLSPSLIPTQFPRRSMTQKSIKVYLAAVAATEISPDCIVPVLCSLVSFHVHFASACS